MLNGKPTVLIIDDVQENIQILGELLERHGIEIAATNSGEKGIAIAEQIPVDLILLDIMMPEMDGFQVCRHLKQAPKTKDIPIIFITAKSDTEDIVTGFDTGGVDYITKPIREKEVLARVTTHLELKKHKDHLQEMIEEKTIELEKAKLKAEAANEAKTRFLVNVHHELKTPMTGIIGMYELLMETQLDAEQRDFLKTVGLSANAQLKVINDVLHFTEAMHGQIHLETRPLNIKSIIKDVHDILYIRAREKYLLISFHIDPAIPEDLMGDPGRLRQILLNICGNAVKFTEHGEVDIRATLAETNTNYVNISFTVSDTGIGIAEDQMGKLFQPFSQIDDSLTRQYGGLGLGLANAKQLIEMMEGTISVTSDHGKGSTFIFSVRLMKL